MEAVEASLRANLGSAIALKTINFDVGTARDGQAAASCQILEMHGNGSGRATQPRLRSTLIGCERWASRPQDVQLRPFGGTLQIAAALQAGQVVAGDLTSS